MQIVKNNEINFIDNIKVKGALRLYLVYICL